ncbi:hypothetical protein PC129_g9982 [Phytophthora cactorum]|nr:hypothetical protein Pcac1_g8761 [Phytophthora cactorum]KAG2855369.1 hypothetical protein PC113_g12492 [Phytophthora cactorum]KAG2901104.1 hypothetical protein PC114_g13306 [Phytophthora cactorum]KAG2916289.1 hypothetical protein PC115_g11083 [Phytophthora cactorum]KAG3015259.1 hypothetical protein PC120_g12256 [Phytophthora cactorum]
MNGGDNETRVVNPAVVDNGQNELMIKALMVNKMSVRDGDRASRYVATVRPDVAVVWYVREDREAGQRVHDVRGQRIDDIDEEGATGEGAMFVEPVFESGKGTRAETTGASMNTKASMDEKVSVSDNETAEAARSEQAVDGEATMADGVSVTYSSATDESQEK